MDTIATTTDVLGALGLKLQAQYSQAKSDRSEVERRWLQDLRQYKGVYEPDEESKIPVNKSRTFTRMTRIKVKSSTARLMDLVFPAGSEDNWSIDPTPVPEMDADPMATAELVGQLGRMPTGQELQIAVEARAKVRASRMQEEIRDQLVDVKYRKLMKLVIQSGNLFGTGILKGPLVNRSYRKAWTIDPTSNSWTLSNVPMLAPFIEFTPVWEMYPDTMATTFAEARYNYQRSVMPKHMVMELTSRPDFSSKKIRQYLKDHPDGDTQMLDWEIELRRLGWNLTGNTTKGKRYEVVEFWGVLDAQELVDIGLDVPDDDQDEFWANIWMLGSTIIKVDVQPIDGMQLPYYAYYWDKDETSIFGEGIPAVMRDDQKALNASTRAMMDNAAICAGPQIEVNVDLLHPDEDPRSVFPFKVWTRSGVGQEAQYPAVRSVTLDSHVQEYMALANFFSNNIHEATIPSYMHGETSSKGSVGRTASGLSMLMSAAQVTFKDQLFSLDDDVQRPFIEAMYHWNMQFNPKDEIKGDFSIQVRGTSSLVAREIRAQNLDQFANSTMNQFDAPFIDRHALNKQRARVLELGDDIVRDKDQALFIIAQQAENNAQPTGTSQGTPAAPDISTGSIPDFGGTEPLQDFGAVPGVEGGGLDNGFTGGRSATTGSDNFPQ